MHILLGRVRRDHSGFTRSRFPSVFNSVFQVCSYFALKKCYFRFAIPVECRRTLLEGISGAYKLSLDKSPILRLHSFLASIYEFENGAQLKLKLFFMTTLKEPPCVRRPGTDDILCAGIIISSFGSLFTEFQKLKFLNVQCRFVKP